MVKFKMAAIKEIEFFKISVLHKARVLQRADFKCFLPENVAGRGILGTSVSTTCFERLVTLSFLYKCDV